MSSEPTGGFVPVSEDVPDLLMMKVLMAQTVERLICCTGSAVVSV